MGSVSYATPFDLCSGASAVPPHVFGVFAARDIGDDAPALPIGHETVLAAAQSVVMPHT